MNAVKVVATLAQKDAGRARSEGQEALREVVLEWLCELHRDAALRAEHMRETLFAELARRAPHIEHEAAVLVVDFIYGLHANTRNALTVLRRMVEDTEAAKPPVPATGRDEAEEAAL